MTSNCDIQIKTTVSTVYVLTLLVLLYVYSSLTLGAEDREPPRAAIIWHELKEQRYHVMISEYEDEVWLPPQIVAQSESPVTTPSLAVNDDQSLMAIWSQQAFGAVRLMFADKKKNEDEWSVPQILLSDGAWNMNPNLVKDGAGQLWLFWSSSIDGDTDIYLMNKSVNSTWSEKQRVHLDNDVPDNKPQARLGQTGDVQLEWFHLDEKTHRYEIKEAQFKVALDAEQAKKMELKTQQAKEEITKLALPNFLPRYTSGVILFKDNIFYQSRRID